MNSKQKITLRIAAIALVFLWAFPPWHHIVTGATRNILLQPRSQFGFYFLFNTEQGERADLLRTGQIKLTIAWGQLALLTLIILVIAAYAYVHYKKHKGMQPLAPQSPHASSFAEVAARFKAKSQAPQTQTQAPQTQSKWWNGILSTARRHPRSVFFAVIVVLFVVASLFQSRRPHQPYTPTPPGYRASNTGIPSRSNTYTRPLTAPNGSAWPNWADYVIGYPLLASSGLSSVTVQNTLSDSGVFVKLISLNQAKAYPVRVCFIPKHSQFQFEKVSQGRYDVRYQNLTTGSILKSQPFTLTETTTESGTQFDKYSLTLYTVLNGNTHTETIDESQF